MKNRKILSIIIPVYNEESFIGELLKRVIKSNAVGFKKEIIVVDDGSTDRTKNILVNTSKKFKEINVIFKSHEGKGSAVKKGLLSSHGEIVLIQDSDLEYDPVEYKNLLKPFIENNADIVYGSRFVSQSPHRTLYFSHYVANNFLTFLSNLFTNLNLTDMETGYKVFRGKIIRKIAKNLRSKRFEFEPEVTAKLAKIKEIKFYEIGISYQGRTYKEGKKINWLDFLKAIFAVLRFNLTNL